MMRTRLARRFDRRQLWVLVAVLAFWSISLWNLDRVPPIQEDEPWILSVGYKFFSRGVFGSDLFAGFYGMEEHYVRMPPLMPLLQGMSSSVMGVGVMQMRLMGIFAGTMTLPLTFVVARKLTNAVVGLVALLLALVWQWSPGGGKFLGSGVPLIDLARIARYDILTAPLGLLALYFFLCARRTGRARFVYLSGMVVGLAGLANLYGFFWLPALSLALVVDRLYFSRRGVVRPAALLALGALSTAIFWFAFMAFNWSDLNGQLVGYSGRFDLMNPHFYLDNLANEGRRYGLGNDAGIFGRVGFWLLAIGAPLSIPWLILRARRERNREAMFLTTTCLVFVASFALFVQQKDYYYLISIVPLVIILVAWFLADLATLAWRITQLAALAVMVLTVAQGGLSIAQMQLRARRIASPQNYFEALRQAIPFGGRVLGHPQYYLALTDRDYRSFVLPFYQSDPISNRAPISFREAIEQIEPQYVLMDPAIIEVFTHRDTAYNRAASDQYWDYMRAHQARIIQEVDDNYGTPIQIYQLNP